MSKTKTTLRLFSAEEKSIMNKWLNIPKGHRLPADEVEAFCKKYNRKVIAIYQYIQRTRNAKFTSKESNIVKPTENLTTLRRNEFVIPVTNWELRSENGQTNLILKFK